MYSDEAPMLMEQGSTSKTGRVQVLPSPRPRLESPFLEAAGAKKNKNKRRSSEWSSFLKGGHCPNRVRLLTCFYYAHARRFHESNRPCILDATFDDCDSYL
jgi:hypothetical protein